MRWVPSTLPVDEGQERGWQDGYPHNLPVDGRTMKQFTAGSAYSCLSAWPGFCFCRLSVGPESSD